MARRSLRLSVLPFTVSARSLAHCQPKCPLKLLVEPQSVHKNARCRGLSILSLPLSVFPLTASVPPITLSAKTPAVVNRRLTFCLRPSTPSQSLPVDLLTARQNAHQSFPSSISLPLPISPLTVSARRQISFLCPSTYSLPAQFPTEVGRRPNRRLCLSTPSVSAHRPILSAKTCAVISRRPIVISTRLNLTVSARLIPRSLCR